MGLDQYLMRKTFAKKGSKEEMYLVVSDTPKEEEVGYWRKSNHIHNWFVKNVQNGVDDCGEYVVTKEQLQELLTLIEEILKDNSKAESLLPCVSGFFFGGTEYDQYYFNDLVESREIIKRAIEDTDFKYQKILYSSSW